MSFGKTLPLSNGTQIPRIGLGTWQSRPNEVENAVEIAVRNGYRHLDLAYVYENQDEVGRALKKVIPSVVKREELFITSKLWNNAHQPDQVEKQLDETLEQLGIDYLDLYLIHFPVSFVPGKAIYPRSKTNPDEVDIDHATSLVDTWKAMIALPKSKVRAVGVSNFTIEYLKGIIDATGVVPAANQFEGHPLLQQPELLKFCQDNNIHVTAYSPLGNNMEGKIKLTDYPAVMEIANRLKATPAQVLIAWATRRGVSVIPKSVQESRIISNFQEVEITDDDFARISALGQGEGQYRYIIPYYFVPSWPVNVFGEAREKDTRHKVKIN